MTSTRPWRLTIEKDNAQCISICGTDDNLRAEFDAWVKYEARHSDAAAERHKVGDSYSEFEGSKVRTVHGFNDSADRTEVVLGYRFADVIGMCLVEL